MVRRLVLLLRVFLLLLVIASGWSAWRGIQVRSALLSASEIATQVKADVRAGDLAGARGALPSLQSTLARASARAHGISWSLSTRIPVLGQNLLAIQRLADAAQSFSKDGIPPVERGLVILERDELVRDGAVDLDSLGRLGAEMHACSDAAAEARSSLAKTQRFLIPPVARRFHAAVAELATVRDSLRTIDVALSAAPSMLGSRGPRIYLVAVQNNAEARATGGLVGAFALLRVESGRLHLIRSGTDSELEQTTPTAVPISDGAATVWQEIGSTRAWFDANLTPHFPDAASTMAALWERQFSQQVDGVLAVDPIVMRELLGVVGDVELDESYSVGPSNVVDFVMHREYVAFSDSKVRKRQLVKLSTRLFDEVAGAPASKGMATALVRSANSGHLFLWSRDSVEQRALEAGIVGGALPTSDTPYLQILTQNFSGNKMDYYIRRRVAVARRPDGDLQVEVSLTNIAPTGLPAIVTARVDRPLVRVPYAQTKVGLGIYGALSSEIGEVSVDGVPVVAMFDRDHGHSLALMSVEVARDRATKIRFVVTEPAGSIAYRQQPLVVPDQLDISIPHRIVGR